ncbi:MAG: GatB/YqeY domain-containing protein [Anaerolineales bacterium]|nr:MAG: GatB/YqeY domain-containing protein [Anaerolineales bacterium]
MSLKTKLEADLKQAMRDNKDLTKRTLRLCLSAVKLAEIEKRSELEDGAILGILQKEVKSRLETIEEAREAGRDDLVQGAQAEIEILQAYLPQPLSDEELIGLVQAAIEEAGATSPQEMGNVMKLLMPRIQGRADGKAASTAVRERLAS